MYDHQADNQYGGNGYGQTGSQYGRCGYDHQADYQYSENECNHRADDQYDGCGSDQADNEGYGINIRIGINQKHHSYGNDSYIYSYIYSDFLGKSSEQHWHTVAKTKPIHWKGWYECL